MTSIGQTFPTPPPPGNSNSNSNSNSNGMTSTGEPTTGVTDTTGPDVTTGISTEITVTNPTTTEVTVTNPSTTNPSTTSPMPECGDGIVDANEECDGGLGGQSCVGLGFVGGVLSCAGNCMFDVTQCEGDDPCGDGIKTASEDCDCGPGPSPCTAAQLGNYACDDFTAPNNSLYHGGTLTCSTPQSCVFNTSACTYCGDAVLNGPEQCDGASLGGFKCTDLGYQSGTLACKTDCTYNTANCSGGAGVCGDGTCNAGEDSCSCEADCPDDPLSCSPCQCGSSGGSCWCDATCVQNNDCCANGPC